MCLSPPRLALGAEESVFMDPHEPTIAPRCPTTVIADKIKHAFSKREQKKERATTIQLHVSSFKEGKCFMAMALLVLQLGLLHMRPIQFWLKQRVPSAAWRHERLRIRVTLACVSALARWRDPPLDKARRDQKEGCHDRQTWWGCCWGALCEGKPTFSLWSEEESGLHINCLEMLAVCQACQFFLPDIRGHHVLICSDSRSVVSYINHQGVIVSKRLCMLVNNLLVWAQNNLRSLKATHVPGKINQGADILSRNNVSSEEWTLHPLVVQRIWEYFGRARVDLFASEDNSHYPIFFTNSTDALAHEWPSLPLYAFPSRSATAGTQASQGTMAQADFNSHPLEEPTVSVRVIQGAESSPVADPLETGPPLSSERQDMASTALVLGPVFVAAQREPFILPERVLNTMAEARAPSTRRLYALKWSTFSAWCLYPHVLCLPSSCSHLWSFLSSFCHH